ncbi:MAG: hypothetical protein NTV51_24380 [Verrucomicrobia bacterium]|nr:hypothetical protein [Verrucomicrobiota bacterium]
MFSFRALLVALLLTAGVGAAPVTFKSRCLDDLVAAVPAILASQNPAGQFGKGLWIVTDQNVLLPLAVAWAQPGENNPFHHRADVLDAIVRGGDALIPAQDADGRFLFLKKDGSKWGQIYMPWTYSRWIRAYQIVRDAMPPEARARWDRALTLGFTGIAKEVAGTKTLANIPTHHAMGLFFASQVFHRDDWAKIAADFMRRAVGEQHPDGYWSEHSGPVINYGFVYVEAVGVYAAASHDLAMTEPLRRAAVFHGHFTYPDGTGVETVDERNPYETGVSRGNVGFTLTPEGRTYFAHQSAKATGRLPADSAATLLRWGEEGEGAAGNDTDRDFDFRLSRGDAAVRRRGPWFIVVSALTAPFESRRWFQDRQNFVSVYHARAGLVLGGGNTKLQPRWSNFTAGDLATFAHRAGDENPEFRPPAGVIHVPASARLLAGDDLGLELDYGGHHAQVRLHIVNDDTLDYIVTGDAALTAHVTLLPKMAEPLRSALTPIPAALKKANVAWDPSATGPWIAHGKARLTLPAATRVDWPVLPHNPYRKDGHAEPAEGRIVLSTPMDGQPQTFRLAITPLGPLPSAP